VNAIDGVICDKSIINSIRDDFSYSVLSYEKMISEMRIFMENHKQLYTQYLGE